MKESSKLLALFSDFYHIVAVKIMSTTFTNWTHFLVLKETLTFVHSSEMDTLYTYHKCTFLSYCFFMKDPTTFNNKTFEKDYFHNKTNEGI